MRSKPSIPEWSSTITLKSRISLSVIDMQKFFITDKNSPWHDTDFLKLVPNIKTLIKTIDPERTIFTMFQPPVDWQTENGSWRTYYYYNQKVTTEVLGTAALDIIDDFMDEVGNPATMLTPKKTASAFASPHYMAALDKADPLFLVVCGIETDYCVLATVIDALNKGYYVIIPKDACASSKKEVGQNNAIGIFERFPEQIWLTDTDGLLQQLYS